MADQSDLRSLLQQALNMRTEFACGKVPPHERLAKSKKFLEMSASVLETSKKAKHAHAFGISLELHATAMVYMFDADPSFAIALSEQSTNDESESKEKKDGIEGFWKNVTSEIEIAKKVAQNFGDTALSLRLLETLANIHKAIDDIDGEISIIETSIHIQRGIGQVIALLEAYQRKLEKSHSEKRESTLKKLARTAEENTELMEVYLKYWVELEWLMTQDKKNDFVFHDYLLANHSIIFRVCIYVGTVLTHPFLSDNISQLTDAAKAFDLAKKIAFALNDGKGDKEYICSLAARQARAFFLHFKKEEREAKIAELQQLQQDLQPTHTDIPTLLEELKAPEDFIPSNMADIRPDQLKRLVEEAKKANQTKE